MSGENVKNAPKLIYFLRWKKVNICNYKSDYLPVTSDNSYIYFRVD